jgi:hypothetical protein
MGLGRKCAAATKFADNSELPELLFVSRNVPACEQSRLLDPAIALEALLEIAQLRTSSAASSVVSAGIAVIGIAVARAITP